MDLRQLSHFVAVAEERSFTRAARRANIVQSGISASIRALERELGAELFVRSRSRERIELTDSGRAFLVEARRALAAFAAARSALATRAGTLTGALTIGMIPTLPPELKLAELVQTMRQRHPGLTIDLRAMNGPVHQSVAQQEVDLGIGPGHGPPGITSILLAEYPLVLACAESHPLAHKRSVAIGALRDEPFIDAPPGWVSRSLTDRAFADAGIERRTVVVASETRLIVELVESGVGVTLVPDNLARYATSLQFVPLRPPVPMWDLTVSFVGPEPANPAAREFLQLLLTDFRDRQG